MKRRATVAALLGLLFLGGQFLFSGGNGLTINPKTLMFEYNGKPYVPVGSGMANTPANLLDTLIDSGVNMFTMAVLPLVPGKLPTPYAYKKGDTIANNWGGWNQSYFDDLTTLAQKLKAKNCTLFLNVFSTCERKSGEGRFPIHLWNKINGGIFDAPAVVPFYDLANKQNIAAQKLLIDKLIDTLKGFDNVGIALQWEIFTGWGQESLNWAAAMCKYIKITKKFAGPVGICTDRPDQHQAMANALNFPIFGLIEAVNIQVGAPKGLNVTPWWASNQPVPPMIYAGYHPRKEGYYHPRNDKTCQMYDPPNAEQLNIQASESNMKCSVQWIKSCCLPFTQYWLHASGRHGAKCQRVKKGCKKCYDFKKVQQALLEFTKTDLPAFIEANASKPKTKGCSN